MSVATLPGEIQSSIENRLRHLEARGKGEVEISPKMLQWVTEMAGSLQASPEDVLRRAVLLLQIAIEGRQRGYEIGMIKKEDAEKLEMKIAI